MLRIGHKAKAYNDPEIKKLQSKKIQEFFIKNFLRKFFLNLFSFLGPVLPLPEMEFLDINLTRDSILLLHAIHSPFYWRILIKPYSALVLKKHIKKIRETRKLVSTHVQHFVEWKCKMRVENSRLRRLEFMPRNLDKNAVQELHLWIRIQSGTGSGNITG